MGRATAKEEREIKADRGILELGGREGEAVSASTNARRTEGTRRRNFE